MPAAADGPYRVIHTSRHTADRIVRYCQGRRWDYWRVGRGAVATLAADNLTTTLVGVFARARLSVSTAANIPAHPRPTFRN